MISTRESVRYRFGLRRRRVGTGDGGLVAVGREAGAVWAIMSQPSA
ncbi:hypothetical protein ARZXY2_3356 [Arthrobacter sp. ZXY-2]|nr:hypothetical protein ARZXY2_3356 [Arthrobacter sp. ZXY-2]